MEIENRTAKKLVVKKLKQNQPTNVICKASNKAVKMRQRGWGEGKGFETEGFPFAESPQINNS